MDQRQYTGALLIAASIIAVIRLKGAPVDRSSPRLNFVVTESVHLARLILRELERS